jgi:hypothetical protein
LADIAKATQTNPLAIIAQRRHKKITTKLNIWNLITDSYAGGEKYIQKDYLFRHPREPNLEYQARKKRAVYFNHVQPLVDILTGFIFSETPERNTPPDQVEFAGHVNSQKNIDQFMLNVAIHSLMYSVGVLVDSPDFDASEIQTEAQRIESGIQAYAVMYFPWQIRDYALNSDGNLLWILLDDSRCEKFDPLMPEVDRIIYTLWTTENIRQYEIKQAYNADTKMSEQEIILLKEKENPTGTIPFRFVNWRDADDDKISESPFEDIALLDQNIYNKISLFDEMVYAGTFRALFFPVTKPEDIPTEVQNNGIGSLSVIPYPANSAAKPFFDGAKLEDVSSYISAIELYLKEIFGKLGLDKDNDKKYVQSGIAKSLEFQKCEALLTHGAGELEATEEFIFKCEALWRGKESEYECEYQKKFHSEEIDKKLMRYHDTFLMPFKSLKKLAVERIARQVFTDADPEELTTAIEEAQTEIDTRQAPEIPAKNMQKLTDEEIAARKEKELASRQNTPKAITPEAK